MLAKLPLKRCIWLFVCVLIGVITPTLHAQDSLDDAVAAALTSFNTRIGNVIRYREIARVADANGAVIYVEVYDAMTDFVYPGVIDWLYANRQTDGWRVSAPGDATYQTAFRALSQVIVDQMDDTPYRTPANPELAPPETLTDYRLPFPVGQAGIVTRGYADHGTGKIDIDITEREIAAVKDGEIVFASDGFDLTTYQSGAWWYWNNVIIRHSEYEYSLYGHIAFDSIPAWIKDACDSWATLECAVTIQAGDVIALEGSTGYSTNPHLHLEFGQGMGVVPYLDLLDADRDGFRDELVYAGYVYAEQNVGFIGFSAEQVMGWEYLTRLTAVDPINP